MRGDVLPRLAGCVVPQPMGMRVQPAERALGAADPAAGEAPVNLVEHLGESRGGDPRDKAAAGRETAVRAHQMLAARAHGARVMYSFTACRGERGSCGG